MARLIHLRPDLRVDELERRYRAAKEPHERTWWQILWLLGRGQLAKDIAESTGYSRYWIGQIAKRYNAEGPAGMRNRQYIHSHRAAPLLSPEQLAELPVAVRGPAPEGDVWTGRLVAGWMNQTLGRPVSIQVGWVYLVRLEGKRRKPRPRHVLADPEQLAAFKKTEVNRPGSCDGFVHPASGRTVFHLATGVSIPLFELELAEFARQVGAGPTKQIVLVLDRAGWHASVKLRVPDHLHLLFLPPYSPELQPAEHLWPLTNTALVNRHFATIDDLEDAQAARCVVLQARPDLIRSTTQFQWWPQRIRKRQGPRWN